MHTAQGVRRSLKRGLAMSVLGIALSGFAAQSAEAAQTKSFVVAWWLLATQSHEDDCAGIEPVAEPGRGPLDTMYRKIIMDAGKSPAETEELLKELMNGVSPRIREMIINRGRINGQPVNVYDNPESVPDPNINTVIGKYGMGLNLDGKVGPASFEDPFTHEQGVDNQYYRAVGCIGSNRAVAPDRPQHWGFTWRLSGETSPAVLISVTGEDLSKDGDVTVQFNKSFERVRLDALGNVRRDMTFRIDPNPRTQNTFKGRIKNGELTIEPGPFQMIGDSYNVVFFDIANTQMRMNFTPDGGLDGYLGGYQSWKEIYFFYSSAGYHHENMLGLNNPGIYYALKKLADYDPDPVTGQNRRISVGYKIEAVPAFVVPDTATPPAATVQASIPAHGKQAKITPVSVPEPAINGGEALIRRLTASQYRRIMDDIFGPTVNVSGRFEPDLRAGPIGGLNAVGTGKVSVSAAGLEQYEATGRVIAAKALDPMNRELLMPCKPVAENGPDDACATQFLSNIGKLLFRRPLEPLELKGHVLAANTAAVQLKNFYAGLELSLAGLLQSPQFLFRVEEVEPDPANPGQYRLDGYAIASRLSFLLWDTAPDPQLLAAAEDGSLHTEKGLKKQVDRLLASRRVADGVRAFFDDMLDLEKFATLSKDGTIYPKFTTEVSKDAHEQTLRTIVDHLVTQRGDYRDLFTTRKTFLTPLLGAAYGVAVVPKTPLGSLDPWQVYEYADNDPHVGIQSHMSFVSLHSHPGRTSPTIRGKAMREILLCQKVPDPPGAVEFTFVQDTANPLYKTARERMKAHANEPMCAGCHKITDPLGFALENFDSAGGFRTTENGAVIDPSGELDGKKFADAQGLGQLLHSNPATTSCMVNKLAAYSVGRVPAKEEAPWIEYLKTGFAENGYRVPDLLRQIVTSKAFYRVRVPEKTASVDAPITLAQEKR